MENPNDKDAAQNQIAAGLPPDVVTDWEMMFVAASRALLLKFSTVQSGMRIPRLFVRREGAERYVDVLDIAAPALVSKAKSSAVVWGAQAAVADSDGVVYFLLCEFKQIHNRRGGTAIAAVRVDFLSNNVETRDPNDCSPAACNLVDLLGADQQGVYATAGFSQRSSSGAFAVHYFVVHLDWAEWVVRKILPLPNVFY